jgi:hypothetical protein
MSAMDSLKHAIRKYPTVILQNGKARRVRVTTALARTRNPRVARAACVRLSRSLRARPGAQMRRTTARRQAARLGSAI